MGKANFQKTPLDITRKNVLTDKVLFGVNRQNNSNVTSVGSPSGGGQGSSIAPATGFLKTSGGSMIGPIAYYGATAVISGSSIDVSSTGAYSSLVYLSTGSDTNLDTIVGASNAGQRLTLVNNGAHKVTIRDSTISGSNIRTLPLATSYVMNSLDKVELFFDSGINKWNLILPAGATITNPLTSDLNVNTHSLTNINTLTFQTSTAINPIITTDGNDKNMQFNIHNYDLVHLSNDFNALPSIPDNGTLELFGQGHGFYGGPLALHVPTFKTVCNVSVSATNPIGQLAFDGLNSSLTQITYACITTSPQNITSGSERGMISFFTTPGSGSTIGTSPIITLDHDDMTLYSQTNNAWIHNWTIFKSGSSNFIQNNFVDTANTNIGHAWLINSTFYMQLVHNTGNDPIDFIYAQEPIWISAGNQKSYIQFDEMTTEPSTPPAGKVRLYSITSGGTQFLVAKWSDGTKSTIVSH